MSTTYVIKGFKNLNEEFEKLDNNTNVEDYTYDTINRGDSSFDHEYEFQVIFK
jgi:hypothetical protein